MIKTEYTVCGKPISECTRGSEKKVVLVCDSCGSETTTNVANYFKCRRNDGKTYCRVCTCKTTAKNRIGVPRKPRLKMSPYDMKRSSYVSFDGYRVIFDPDYYNDYGSFKGYVKEHKAVIEKHIGRKLIKGEIIHHINLDKLNNSLENLILCVNEKQHKKYHNQLDKIVANMIQNGEIVFDRNVDEYRRK